MYCLYITNTLNNISLVKVSFWTQPERLHLKNWVIYKAYLFIVVVLKWCIESQFDWIFVYFCLNRGQWLGQSEHIIQLQWDLHQLLWHQTLRPVSPSCLYSTASWQLLHTALSAETPPPPPFPPPCTVFITSHSDLSAQLDSLVCFLLVVVVVVVCSKERPKKLHSFPKISYLYIYECNSLRLQKQHTWSTKLKRCDL